MRLISERRELDANIDRLASYLSERDGANREFAEALIQRGICFVVAKKHGRPFFAPSRFVGYRNNSRHAHMGNDEKDGRETNDAIASVLRREPELNAQLEKEYMAFCATLDLEVRPTGNFGVSRKFWDAR